MSNAGPSHEQRVWFEQVCVELHERYAPLEDGEPASYIPELSAVDPDRFAIAAVTLDGQPILVGDVDHEFTIQSISKLLVYGLALELHGRDAVLAKVGVSPTGDSFNAIELDEATNRAPNPMVNAGAIAITDLIAGDSVDERVETMRSMYERYLGSSTGDRPGRVGVRAGDRKPEPGDRVSDAEPGDRR